MSIIVCVLLYGAQIGNKVRMIGDWHDKELKEASMKMNY